ncbi:unnamed protein product [Microthlaspi erraticum]|uniref:Uncharacterized protein n=1 Tax=Microthlaspi erraticum TaxID=1685480 RepID=A0A6D2JIP5_9BRAS|nr:unnamed protein product [Microthlaspi erraticum]CAA7048942.1 unnamed protein product [Microthlaspi erraticum]
MSLNVDILKVGIWVNCRVFGSNISGSTPQRNSLILVTQAENTKEDHKISPRATRGLEYLHKAAAPRKPWKKKR